MKKYLFESDLVIFEQKIKKKIKDQGNSKRDNYKSGDKWQEQVSENCFCKKIFPAQIMSGFKVIYKSFGISMK